MKPLSLNLIKIQMYFLRFYLIKKFKLGSFKFFNLCRFLKVI